MATFYGQVFGSAKTLSEIAEKGW
ncbi:MAG: hypothetical protein [Bacteriophage sp.]|nr:MAG: hypothetical protein [Bacteriophage sp.]